MGGPAEMEIGGAALFAGGPKMGPCAPFFTRGRKSEEGEAIVVSKLEVVAELAERGWEKFCDSSPPTAALQIGVDFEQELLED